MREAAEAAIAHRAAAAAHREAAKAQRTALANPDDLEMRSWARKVSMAANVANDLAPSTRTADGGNSEAQAAAEVDDHAEAARWHDDVAIDHDMEADEAEAE